MDFRVPVSLWQTDVSHNVTHLRCLKDRNPCKGGDFALCMTDSYVAPESGGLSLTFEDAYALAD
jgi:hypothetical protein